MLAFVFIPVILIVFGLIFAALKRNGAQAETIEPVPPEEPKLPDSPDLTLLSRKIIELERYIKDFESLTRRVETMETAHFATHDDVVSLIHKERKRIKRIRAAIDEIENRIKCEFIAFGEENSQVVSYSLEEADYNSLVELYTYLNQEVPEAPLMYNGPDGLAPIVCKKPVLTEIYDKAKEMFEECCSSEKV